MPCLSCNSILIFSIFFDVWKLSGTKAGIKFNLRITMDNELQLKVKEFILDKTFADKSKINNETLIFREGYLDSMGFTFLISFLEKEFAISLQDRDLIEENFESINAITSFVLKKKLS
ncbi:MAG: acyl carrier protein [Bacteroidales bacterium]|nr:acyl carrier protein [Bacteroidales bacterium]